MHENRETSGVPRPARERGRSAKAQSHKADAHALEESDRAILSMNQTNKEERSSAEPGEKRARAKENIVSFNTRPDTARGNRVCQGWSGVRGATLLVTHPRWEPYAGKPLVRICAGGDQRWSSLPRQLPRIFSVLRVDSTSPRSTYG
jgi:hypothetical protein